MSSWYGDIKHDMPVPQVFDITATVTVCPDHTYFPKGRQSKEVGGCALPGKVWLKGHLVDGKVVPESMEVFGHEMAHILNFAYPGSVRNPDEEANK